MKYRFEPFLKEEERKNANPAIIRQFKKDAEERLKRCEYNPLDSKIVRDEIKWYEDLLTEIEGDK